MQLSLEQFEVAMTKQEGKSITVCHYGSFNHSSVYEKFKMEVYQLKYQFLELALDSPDDEFMNNTLSKQAIKEITYLDFSRQIQLRLVDKNILLIDLEEEIAIDEKK